MSCNEDIRPETVYPVCERCSAKIKPAFPRPPKGLDSFYCGGIFENGLRELIHAYKYQGKEYLADYFVEMCLCRWGLSSTQFQAVVAVPISFWRGLKRGFNPPGVVAEKLAQKWGVPFLKNVLRRHSGFPSQTHLGRAERRLNASRSYYRNHRTDRVKGGRVFLVDDVLTTGATLSVCAKLLREVGFDKVVGASIAYDPLLPGRHSREGGKLGTQK